MNGPFDLKNYKNLKKVAPHLITIKKAPNLLRIQKTEVIRPAPYEPTPVPSRGECRRASPPRRRRYSPSSSSDDDFEDFEDSSYSEY